MSSLPIKLPHINSGTPVLQIRSLFLILASQALFISSFLLSVKLTFAILGILIFVYVVSQTPKSFLFFIFFILIFFNHFRNTPIEAKAIYDYRLFRMNIIDLFIIAFFLLQSTRSLLERGEGTLKIKSISRPLLMFVVIVAFCGFCGIIIGKAGVYDTFLELRPFIYLIMIYIITRLLISSNADIEKLLKFILIMTGFRAFHGIILMWTDPGRHMYSGQPFTFVSQEVIFFLFFVCIGIATFLRQNRVPGIRKIVKWFGLIVIISLLYSYRRGIYIGLILGLLAIAYILPFKKVKTSLKKIIWIPVFLAIILIVYPAFTNLSIISRLTSVTELPNPRVRQEGTEASNYYRIWETINAWENLKESPILGIGWGTKWDVHVPFILNPGMSRLTETHFHNSWLSIWLKGGMVALFSFAALIIMSVRRAKWVLHRGLSGISGLLIPAIGLFMSCFAVSSLFGDYIYYWRVALLFGFLLAISDICYWDERGAESASDQIHKKR